MPTRSAMNQTIAFAGLVGIPLVEPVIYRSISLVRRSSESLAPADLGFGA